MRMKGTSLKPDDQTLKRFLKRWKRKREKNDIRFTLCGLMDQWYKLMIKAKSPW